MRLPADRLPGLPGDPEDHPGDDDGDDRIGHREAERDQDGAEHHPEADEAVGPRVVAVGYQGWAVQSPAGAEPHLGGYLVPSEADGSGSGERQQMIGGLRADDLLHREEPGQTGTYQDRGNDRQAGVALRPA